MSVYTYKMTQEDSIENIRNEYREILEMYDPKMVVVKRVTPPEGSMCLFEITVKAPSYYLETEDDIEPKRTNELTFFAEVPNGFPEVKPTVYYPSNRRLASVNVFKNGIQCIDTWKKSSSLSGVVDKTIKDIIHDPIVTRYDSMANCSIESWQKDMTERGLLPTIEPLSLYAKVVVPKLPTPKPKVVKTAPSLPRQR